MNPCGMPAKSALSSCSIGLRRPCMTSGACSTVPPATYASAWWPRHTPSTGTSAWRSTSSETPTSRACSGRPGPGEITMLSTSSAASSLPRQLVVAHDERLLAVDLAQQMEEVERVGVVVVDQQRAHRRPSGAHILAPAGRGEPLRVAVLGSTGGWHAERLERALTARGHDMRVRPGDADGRPHRRRSRERRECARRLRRRARAGDPARLARAGRVPRRRAARAGGRRRARGQRRAGDRAHRRQVPRLGAAGRGRHPDAADRRLRARRRRAGGVRRARRRRDRQAAVRLDGLRDGARRGPGRRAAGVPRARARAGRLLPAGDAAARGRRRARVRGRRPRGRRDRARRRRAGGRTWRAAPAPGRSSSTPRRAELCVRAAAALGADYAGVDLLRAADGRDYVLEVNGIPGWHGRRAGDAGSTWRPRSSRTWSAR